MDNFSGVEGVGKKENVIAIRQRAEKQSIEIATGRRFDPRDDNVLSNPEYLQMSMAISKTQKRYCVYIITNSLNTVLYTGVTGNLVARMYQHKNKSVSSFSSRYNLNKLVYDEVYEDVQSAITREKQIKAGNRQKKINLVKSFNSEWKDLYGTII